MLSVKSYFKYKSFNSLRVKSWRKKYHTNINKKKVRVAILISDEKDFRIRKISR